MTISKTEEWGIGPESTDTDTDAKASQPQLAIAKPDPRLKFKPAVQGMMDSARRFRSASGDMYDGRYADLQELMYAELYMARVHALEDAVAKIKANWVNCNAIAEVCTMIRGMA